MEQAGAQTRPVPAPRRLYPEVRVANYENIDINVGSGSTSANNHSCNNNNHNNNKKLNINAENLHDSCAEKKLPASSHSKLILQEHNVEQPIYGPDANENVPAEPLYATPKPAPRQRALAELLLEDEHVGEAEGKEEDQPAIASPKAMRAAPQVPSKPLNIEADRRRAERYSISSELSTTSISGGGGGGVSGANGQPENDSRYTSNASLDCSESSQSGKFKSPSPGYVDEGNAEQADENHQDHGRDLEGDSDTETETDTETEAEAEAERAASSDQSELSASCDDDK